MAKKNPDAGALQPALAGACGRWAPIVGSCTNDQSPITSAVKFLPARVGYRATPNGARKCSQCRSFIAATQTCTRVSGPISPDGWSALWVGRN
ncbi:MAG: hypothetical protein ACM3X0_17405 [Bacteroidota bacterium]